MTSHHSGGFPIEVTGGRKVTPRIITNYSLNGRGSWPLCLVFDEFEIRADEWLLMVPGRSCFEEETEQIVTNMTVLKASPGGRRRDDDIDDPIPDRWALIARGLEILCLAIAAIIVYQTYV